MAEIGDRVIGLRGIGVRHLDEIMGTIVSDRNGLHGIEFDEDIDGHNLNGEITSGRGWFLHPDHYELIEKGEDMKRSNPKSFRNGDVIKVSNNGTYVFVKFGENYYNLSDGGQMKAYKYLPRGRKEVITNLSGLGEFFLMDPDELRSSFQETDEEEDEDDSRPLATGPGSGSSSIINPADWTRIIEEMEKWQDADISSTDNNITYIDATHGK